MTTESSHVLPDILDHNLKLVICGTAAGDKSAGYNSKEKTYDEDEKAYYAGFGNVFYPTMALCGFTPYLLRPKQFREMIKFGIGFTDLAKFTHGMDKSLKKEDHDPKGFEEKILKFQPEVVCFNGKEAAMIYLKTKTTKEISYGLQQAVINKTKLFVAPSTSPTAKRYWDERYWQQLKDLIVW